MRSSAQRLARRGQGVSLLLLLVLLLVVPGRAVAQSPPFVEAEGTVSRVMVEGNRRIEEATILAVIGMRRGDEITPYKVRRDLKAVHGTGFFDDVRVEAFPEPEGVRLVFRVREKPAVRDVRLEGNRRLKEDDIREVIDIRAFAVLNDREVNENVERIRDLYVEKGYYLVDIDPEVVWVGDDQVDLVIRFDENQKVVIQRIDFSGNEAVPASRLRRFMQLKEGGVAPWLTGTGNFKRDSLEMDQQIIRQVYLEEGYINVEVSPPRVYLSPDMRFIYISYHIEEGEQYRIGQVDVTGDFVPEEGLTRENVMQLVQGRAVVEVQDDLWREATGRRRPLFDFETRGPALVEGETFRYTTFAAVQGAIVDFYQDRGYAHVNVDALPSTDPDTATVHLTYRVQTGEKYRFGRIEITGNDPTFDKVVRRELVFSEGDVYSGSALKASRARLMRLGFFSEVNITTPRGAEPDVLDVQVQIAEQPTGSFSLGLGFSNLEQFVFTGSVSKNNFMGLGYIMSAMVNWSALRRQGNVSFFDPYFLDSRWTFRIDAYSLTREFILSEYQRGGTIEIGRYLDARDDIRLAVQYTFEDVGLTSLDPFRRRMLGGQLFANGLTSSMGMTFNIDKRNNRIMATRGMFASLSASLAGGFRVDKDRVLSLFGGDFNFVETRANFRFFQPLLPDSEFLVFRMNSTIGFIASTDGRVVPWIHRYRAGGINSVRGYNWFSLGPVLRSPGWQDRRGEFDDPVRGDDTLIVGGNQTWVNNFEIESPILGAAGISAVVFFDAGNAFGDPWGVGFINPLGLRFAYGAGIRWRSPIGPLRFEYGIPIAPRENERRGVFDFSIGSFF